MKIAYFDCLAGISGDMTLGALLSAGADEQALRRELGKLPDIEFDLRISKTTKSGIEAADVQVIINEDHHHRRLADIINLIEKSGLSEITRSRAVDAFRRLADAEAAVHGTGPEEVHFHEVGAVDAIVDIVGSMICAELLGIEKAVSSPLPMGRGYVKAAHGLIPLPAPAALELVKGVPVYSADVEGELVTPTGAAILRTLASEFGGMPDMKVQNTGYGAGKTEFPFPNLLRVIVGETAETPSAHCKNISIVETNIDDMNPEFYNSVFEALFSMGALDVYLTPVIMKKTRPGVLLTAVCPPEKTEDIASVILRETSSLGVRIHEAKRKCLERDWQTVSTKYGEIRVKTGLIQGKPVKASPEYEDCRKAAEAHNVPVREVYEAALAQYLNISR